MMNAIHKTITKDEKYLHTLKGLRTRNFSMNLPLLLLSDKLPEGQVYREYADGRIEIQEIYSEGSVYKYKVIGHLSAAEADGLRRTYGLL